MQRRLSWALTSGGLLGLVWTVAAIIPAAIFWGAARVGYTGSWVLPAYSLTDRLPSWLQWQGGSSIGSGTGACLFIVALLCVLLLIHGTRPAQSVAIVGLLWFGYVVATFSSGAYWSWWIANTGDVTPLLLMTLASLVVVPTVSVCALLASRRLRDEVGRAVPVGQARPADGGSGTLTSR